MKELGKYIFYSVISAVIFIVVYSIAFDIPINGGDFFKSSPSKNVPEKVNLPCRDSLIRYLESEDQKGERTKRFEEVQLINNKEELATYLEGYGAHKYLEIKQSLDRIPERNFPLYSLILKVTQKGLYGEFDYFEFGICEGIDNEDYKYIHSVDYV